MEASTSTSHDPENPEIEKPEIVAQPPPDHQNQNPTEIDANPQLSGEMEASTSNDPENPEIDGPLPPDHQNPNPTESDANPQLSGKQYFDSCVPLREAALKGDWNEANKLLGDQPNRLSKLRMPITKGHATLLHVATGAGKTTFVQEILKSMQADDNGRLTQVLQLLQQKDKKGNNAFCFAAATGNVEIAKLMLKRDSGLVSVCGSGNMTPLYMAVLFEQNKMATFLYDKTKNNLTLDNGAAQIFFQSINTGLYDMAFKLLTSYPELAEFRCKDDEGLNTNDDEGLTALHVLAHKPNSMTTDALKLVDELWKNIKLKVLDDVDTPLITRPTKLLFDAAKMGNFEFLTVLLRSYPDLVYQLDEKDRNIFHIAVMHRHTNVLSLIYEIGFDKELLSTDKDVDKNNMLHLAAIYPDTPPASVVPGAALELQRELRLFEEVNMLTQPNLREEKNGGGKTPKELFTESHIKLRKSGEVWMKSTAESCMLVATLIATVVFTSSFTVPGGNDNNDGRPIHLNKTMFKVFVMSDATALSSSCTSILMFLSILTSRYAEQDFLISLPLKLMVGLLTLFISIISMMIAFSSSFFLFYPHLERLNWITMSTAALVTVPITLYGRLEYPLLRDIFHSTFPSWNLFTLKKMLNMC